MNKELINQRFAKHLKDYNENAKVQRRMAEKLITLSQKNKYKNILEIGCGTGFLTKLANQNLEFENYIAIDLVGECEPFIKQINPDIKFLKADAEKLTTDFKADLIISNAALQWTNCFQKTVENIQNLLNTDGEFIFSTFGKENFRELFYILGTSLDYYSITELKQMFPSATIYPEEVHILSFKTAKDVLKHLQLTGVNAIENKKWTKGDLKSFENAYSNICTSFPTLTYNPIYISIRK